MSFEVFFRTDSINQPEVSTCNPLRTVFGQMCVLKLHIASGEIFLIICCRTGTENIGKVYSYLCMC